MLRREFLKTGLGLAGASLLAQGSPAWAEERATCYNCPAEWANWASVLKAFRQKTGIFVPIDNRASGMALTSLIAEKQKPVADFVYLGGQYGAQAKAAGVLAPYKPAMWDQVPGGLKDPEGYWTALHVGTLGLFINKAALGGKPVPKSWKDLADPMYRGMIGYGEPTTAANGYILAIAVNEAFGGSFENFDPAIKFFQSVKANEPILPKQTAYAQVLSGEIPIFVDLDFNAYRAKYADKGPIEFVIPEEGTISFPYVAALVSGGANPDQGKKLLDFVLSDEGQRLWSLAYVRPVRTSAMDPAIAAQFLLASEYARAKTVDLQKVSASQPGFLARYQAEVR
jgi:putative spermidine/putrescine transport system substrate-binding protein